MTKPVGVEAGSVDVQCVGWALRRREEPCPEGAVGKPEAIYPPRGRLAEGNGPLGVGDGGRKRLGVRAQARDLLSGCAGKGVHAFSSPIGAWTHTRDAGPSARS